MLVRVNVRRPKDGDRHQDLFAVSAEDVQVRKDGQEPIFAGLAAGDYLVGILAVGTADIVGFLKAHVSHPVWLVIPVGLARSGDCDGSEGESEDLSREHDD